MSLLSYGVFFLGVVLGGVVLLVIFSLLAMAQKGDAYQEHMDFVRRPRPEFIPYLVQESKSANPGAPVNPDLRLVDAP